MTSSFASQIKALRVVPPDPHKHVNYTLGMILGVDDFTQEFAYLSGHDQWLARDLIGYGTVCGLQVTTDTDSDGHTRVNVTPGTALSPRGQLIRVTPAQCASLNDWLTANPRRLESPLSSPPGDVVTLYVVLCYRECPTDTVPIPGEPCRSEDQLMAPSRLGDDFRLELRYDSPGQQEEEALRDFVAWLRQFTVTGGPGTFASLQDFEQAVRSSIGSPPASPPNSLSQPPGVIAGEAGDYLRAAFRIWATELRPQCRAQDRTGDVPDEDCIMLAKLMVPVVQKPTGELVVDPGGTITIDEEHRPYVIHLRLLQEWMLCGGIDPVLNGDVTGAAGSTTVVQLQNVPVVKTQLVNGQVLAVQNGQWQAANLPTASGNFVEHPADLPRYSIVAAGIVKGDGTNRSPVYNGLSAHAISDGNLKIQFNGYQQPQSQPGSQYIVKALLVFNDLYGFPSVVFHSFDADGIVIFVAEGGNPVNRSPELEALEFMIEVSQYFGDVQSGRAQRRSGRP